MREGVVPACDSYAVGWIGCPGPSASVEYVAVACDLCVAFAAFDFDASYYYLAYGAELRDCGCVGTVAMQGRGGRRQ